MLKITVHTGSISVWTVFFMRKVVQSVALCAMAAVLFWCGGVIADREKLDRDLIRLHVVAASDSEKDQAVKFRVRDAVVESLQSAMDQATDVEAAKAYLQENLPKIQATANRVLEELGLEPNAVVTFCKEQFDTRVYDTFTLPAGIYDSLRVVIGEGEGHNWWCVVFPSLCLPTTAEAFQEVASGAGFSEPLTGALTGEKEYELRFFLLDWLGRLRSR